MIFKSFYSFSIYATITNDKKITSITQKDDSFIGHDDGGFYVGISNYNDSTLSVVKEALKTFYPTGYETVYKKVQKAIRTGEKEEKQYYDNRYFASGKFTSSTSIIIGAIGVKY